MREWILGQGLTLDCIDSFRNRTSAFFLRQWSMGFRNELWQRFLNPFMFWKWDPPISITKLITVSLPLQSSSTTMQSRTIFNAFSILLREVSIQEIISNLSLHSLRTHQISTVNLFTHGLTHNDIKVEHFLIEANSSEVLVGGLQQQSLVILC